MKTKPENKDPLALNTEAAPVDSKKIELEREMRKADLRAIIRTPAGLRWFRRFFEENGLLSNPWTPDERLTSHRCGEKNVALKIFGECCAALNTTELGELIFREQPKK
jgi:hypothetical protein